MFSRKTVAIVTFPGSNCDDDCHHAYGTVLGAQTVRVWHKDEALPPNTDLVVLPGGFSYGDYLRCGAIARFSPIMGAVARFARDGGTVLGICNGFQILCEAGLLPGALLRNRSLRFVCDTVSLRVSTSATRFTSQLTVDAQLRVPIAHGDGCYFIDDAGLRDLHDNDRILLTYQDNPNGSRDAIAGITNAARNVFGLMPHPERVCEAALGGTDGVALLAGLIQ